MLHSFREDTLEFDVDERGLRDVRVAGTLLADRVYLAVRTPDWSTVAPILSEMEINEFGQGVRVSATGRHLASEVEIEWRWDAEVTPAGLHFVVHATFIRRSELAKVGLNVHHNLDQCRGRPYRARLGDSVQWGLLPDGIARGGSLRQLFDPYESLDIYLDRLVLRHTFTGDRFEMQDHRNWTDYELKSYGTPLSVPWPQVHPRGDSIRQSVRITADGARTTITSKPPADRAETLVYVAAAPLRWVPTIASRISRQLEPKAAPGHIANLHLERLVVDQDASASTDRIREADRLALELGIPLEVSTIRDLEQTESWIDELSRLGLTSLERVSVVPPNSLSPGPIRLSARQRPAISVGPRASFAELNTARPEIPDGVGLRIPISPTFHACDDRSMLHNLRSLPEMVRAATHIYPGSELSFGPITLIPDGGPYACGAVDPDGGYTDVDSRLHEDIGALWTMGVLAGLAGPARLSVCLHDVWGPRGIVTASDTPLRRLLSFLGSQPGPWFALESSEWSLIGLATDTSTGRVAVLGNLDDQDADVRLDGAQRSEVGGLTPGSEGWEPKGSIVEVPARNLLAVRLSQFARQEPKRLDIPESFPEGR